MTVHCSGHRFQETVVSITETGVFMNRSPVIQSESRSGTFKRSVVTVYAWTAQSTTGNKVRELECDGCNGGSAESKKQSICACSYLF